MLTSFAWTANAPRSLGSVVSIVPPGSAHATTMASSAEPRRASRRSSAARRASGSGTFSITSHVFRKRFSPASRRACPALSIKMRGLVRARRTTRNYQRAICVSPVDGRTIDAVGHSTGHGPGAHSRGPSAFRAPQARRSPCDAPSLSTRLRPHCQKHTGAWLNQLLHRASRKQGVLRNRQLAVSM